MLEKDFRKAVAARQHCEEIFIMHALGLKGATGIALCTVCVRVCIVRVALCAVCVYPMKTEDANTRMNSKFKVKNKFSKKQMRTERKHDHDSVKQLFLFPLT